LRVLRRLLRRGLGSWSFSLVVSPFRGSVWALDHARRGAGHGLGSFIGFMASPVSEPKFIIVNGALGAKRSQTMDCEKNKRSKDSDDDQANPDRELDKRTSEDFN